MLSFFGDYNEGNFLFLGDWGAPILWALGVLAIGVLLLSWFDLASLRGPRRGLLITLRGLAFALGIALLMEPALELKHVTRVKNHVAVLVDSSRSSALPTGDGETRFERSQQILRDLGPLFTTPQRDHVFDLYEFSGELSPTSYDALISEEARPIGSTTDIAAALEGVRDRYDSTELGGVVLISDGIDNGSIGARVRPGEQLDEETEELVRSLRAPLYAFATAEPGELRDIAIERVIYDDFAFVRNAVAIEVEITVLGFDSGRVPVTLQRQGETLQTRTLELEEGRQTYRLTFEFVPELIGKEIYSVQLPVLEGEALEENNRSYFVVKVIRDKIRVLQVVGRPSWDERFLRQLLKGNPNVDLISFFILRTREDLQLVPESELSLIPFPTDELFQEQLGSFDMVIFQNFTYRPYGMSQYLPLIRDYVRDGGGFVMIGGEQSFASGGYTGTAVEEILPVELPTGGSARTLIDLDRFRPHLTSAGQRHPITRLDFERDANRTLWETLPPVVGSNVVLGARDNTTVLLEHPDRTANGGPMPILTVGEYGEGRSMALTIDGSWNWSFGHVRQGGSSRPYTSFWNSAIRWLIRDPQLNLIQVEIPEEIYEPGEHVSGRVRVFQPDYSAAVGVRGTLRIRRRGLENLARDEGEIVLESGFVTDDRGQVDLEYALEEPGAYTVHATAEIEAGDFVEDEEIFLGISQSQELREIEPRVDLLTRLAEAGGGQRWSLPDHSVRGLQFEEARVMQVDRRRVIDLWNRPWLLLSFAFLFGVDWSLRRRWGRL